MRLAVIPLVCLLLGCVIIIITFKSKEYEETSTALTELEQHWEIKQKKFYDRVTSLKDTIQTMNTIASDHYGGRTLFSDTELILEEYEPSDKHAIVTMIGSTSYVHSYWMGAISVIQMLREVKTRVPHIVVMVRESVLLPPIAFETFDKLGAELIYVGKFPVASFAEMPGPWEGAFDKLHVWNLTQFDKVLFVDADIVLVQNIDHLLQHEELTASATVKGCACPFEFPKDRSHFTVGSGFFVCQPSLSTYSEMMELASKRSPDPEDMQYFEGNWHWGDQEMLRVVFTQKYDKWKPLPKEYDLPLGLCSCPNWRTQPYSYHFVCTPPISKPWAEPQVALYNEGVQDCVIEVYHLWFRFLAKAFNHGNWLV